MNDPLGDMLTRIRNAQERRRPKVSSPASNLRARVDRSLRCVPPYQLDFTMPGIRPWLASSRSMLRHRRSLR